MTTFKHFEKTGLTICKMPIKGKLYIGTSQCHPEDKYSERVGNRLAHDRASIEYLCDQRDAMVCQLKVLKHLLSIYDQSVKTNKNSYEYKMLVRQINILSEDIEGLRFVIREAKEVDKEYVKGYARIVKRKEADSDNGDSI